MKKSWFSSFHRVPTAVMKRNGRKKSCDSHAENPSPNCEQNSSSDPVGSEPAPPFPGDAGGISHGQSHPRSPDSWYSNEEVDPRHLPLPPLSFDSQSPTRAVDLWGDTFVPETYEDDCAIDCADGNVAAFDSEAAALAGWIVPDTYDGFDNSGPILSGSNPKEKVAEEKAREDKAAAEKVAVEKTLEPWEDPGYIQWENAMYSIRGGCLMLAVIFLKKVL